MTGKVTPEFSRPVAADAVRAGATTLDIEANAGERAALAERLGLIALDHLAATLRLAPAGDDRVRLEGDLAAEVTQACVISLAPVKSRIRASVERLYGPGDVAGSNGEVIVTPDEEDPPEPIVDGVIDIGEAVAEQLALELDPFPRVPGAIFEGLSSEPGGLAEGARPFAVLAKLRKKPG